MRQDARQYLLNMVVVTGGNKQDLRGLCWQQPPVWSWDHFLFGSPACASTQAVSPLCSEMFFADPASAFLVFIFSGPIAVFYLEYFLAFSVTLISPIQLYAYFITLILSSGGPSLHSLQ